ncbi:XRE family transcriptional regulator [Pseudomonas syringae]|uniref:XRE family transcriptional regulator n=1 Tax=Pseudomonas syringae TaxID=317 RepID=UPI001F1C968C|nr:S24 family peptidase [Pseudomonas syringae]
MITIRAMNESLGQRIKRYRKEARLSQASLAKACGWDSQSRVGNYEKDTREPSLGDIQKIAKALGINEAELLLNAKSKLLTAPVSTIGGGSNVEQGPPITSATRRIDIVGTAQLGQNGYWVGLEVSDGFVETYSRDEDAYALRLKGDSMSPAIRNGWVAVCEPNHRLVSGEYVMVTTTDGQSMVKELLFENEEEVSLMSVNSAYGERRNIPRSEIDRIHYVGNILAPSKVLGRY